MDLTTAQSCNVEIYVENLYRGNLSTSWLKQVREISWTEWLTVWLRLLSSEMDLAPDCELSLRLTGDEQIRILNKQYRAIDKATDVLALAATEAEIILPSELEEPLYLGDIIISLDTAKRQAQAQNHSLVTELAWLSSHGLLHLLGWDHPDEESLEKMLAKQAELIKLLSI